MTGAIRALVALEQGVDRDLVQASLPLHSEIEIVGVVEGLDASWKTLQETPTDLLMVACADYSDRALFLIDGASKDRPDRPIIVLCNGSPNGFIRRVFEAGADDVLTLPEAPEGVRFALQKALARRQGAGAGGMGTAAAPMLVVLGPKGGTGKTLTTCNLGVSIAQTGRRVAVVDLDLQFGDVGLALGLTPERTIYDLAKSGGSIDAEKVEGYLTEHSSGLRVLLAPTRPDHAGLVSVELLREVYSALRSSYDFVIVDTPPGFMPEVIASIDSATDICLVGMLDALSLKNTKLGLETLELMGFDSSRIRLLLNRSDTRVGITREDVISVLGRAPDISVPSDRDIPVAINEGLPIVIANERSEAAKAFQTLASLYLEPAPAPVPVLAAKGERTSVFSRRGRR
jgi:pilus assembly protein CpaE